MHLESVEKEFPSIPVKTGILTSEILSYMHGIKCGPVQGRPCQCVGTCVQRVIFLPGKCVRIDYSFRQSENILFLGQWHFVKIFRILWIDVHYSSHFQKCLDLVKSLEKLDFNTKHQTINNRIQSYIGNTKKDIVTYSLSS